MQETWVWPLGWEDPLEKGKATHSVFWPRESPGLYSPLYRRVEHNWATFTYVINTWKPKWDGDYLPAFLTFFLQENQLVESLVSSQVWVRSTGFHGWREDPTFQYQLVRTRTRQLQPSNTRITASLLFSDTQQPKDSLRAWSFLAHQFCCDLGLTFPPLLGLSQGPNFLSISANTPRAFYLQCWSSTKTTSNIQK